MSLLLLFGSLDPNVTVTAPMATATADAPTPAPGITLTAPLVTATADALTPAVSGSASATAPMAEATADAPTPSVAAGDTSVTATIATATADALTPTRPAGADAPLATATSDALAPTVSGTASVTAPLALATADAIAPTIEIVLSAPVATAAADAPVADYGLDATVEAPLATATGQPGPPLAPTRTGTGGVDTESTFPAVTLIRSPSFLGAVVHEFTSQDGNSFLTRLGEWEANEEAPGGFAGASGMLSDRVYRKHPEVFRFGTGWRTFLESDGTCLWAGRLKEPLDTEGQTRLVGTGRASLAERNADPSLYQSYDLSLWHEIRPGKTLGPSETTSWGISFSRRVVVSQAIAFVAPGQELRTVAFTYQAEGAALEASTMYIAVAHVPENLQKDIGSADHPVVFEISLGGTDVNAPSPLDSAQKYTVDLTQQIPVGDFAAGAYDPDTTVPETVPFKVTCISITVGDSQRGATQSDPEEEAHVRLDNLRVNAIAVGDRFTASDLALDVAGQLGVANDIDPNGANILPFWLRAGETYGAALDHAALLSGWRWLLLDSGTRAYLDFGPYRKRGYRAIDTRAQFDLEPGETFNIVQVPVMLADDQTSDLITVRADPDPISGRRNIYTRLVNEEPFVNEDYAREFGERILRRLQRPRWGGSGRVVEIASQGVRQSAQHLNAGDVIRTRVPRGTDSVGLRIGSIHRTEEAVELEFDSEIRVIDRILARRARRKAVRKGTA